MDRIEGHRDSKAHSAFDSIDRAGEIILDIDGKDRVALSDPLGEIVSVLHFGLLPAVYFRSPDLRPAGGETADHQHVS
ncbi:MAG: hypothetical protein ACJ8EE_06505 [Bradyrhizobium sp.]